MSVFFYVLGTIIEAAADDVDTFIAGAVLYQIGYTSVLLLVEVVIADTTSLRSRVFFSYIPALPFIVSCAPVNLSRVPLNPIDQYLGIWRCFRSRSQGDHLALGYRHVVHYLHRVRHASRHFSLVGWAKSPASRCA